MSAKESSRDQSPMADPDQARRASSTPSTLAEEKIDDEEDLSQTDLEQQTKNGVQVQQEAEGNAPAEGNQGLKLLFIVVALVLSVFLVALDMTIVATAIPRITDEFKSLEDVGWYGSAFFLTVASFQSTWGKAYKYFPLKTSFLLTIFIFELGSLICGVAQDSTTLIVGRAIAGAGGAGIAAGAYTIIAFSAPPGKAAAFTGILGAVYAVASVVGPLLGGVFTDNLSWRWCFYINLPIGGVAAAIILFFFRTPEAAKPVPAPLKEKLLQMDLPGTFIFMASMVCFILALQWGGVSKPWKDSQVIGTLVGFVVILAVFAVFEHFQGDRALLVPRLLSRRTITLLSLFQIFNSGAFLMLLYYLPIYFQVARDVSAAQSGIRNLPFILGIALMTIVSGIVITVTGIYVPVLILGAILATVGTGMIYTLDVNSGPNEWIGYQALAGIGLGFGIQVPIIVAQAVVDPPDVSSITAIIVFFQSLSGAVFVSVAQSLFANRLLQEVPNKVPGANPQLVLAAGATEVRKVFPASQLPGIIASYMDGLKDAYILSIALMGVATIVTLVTMILDRRRLPVGKGAPVGAA